MFDITFDSPQQVFDVVFDTDGEGTHLNAEFDNIIVKEVKDYNLLENKPKLNGIEISGDKTSADYGIDQTYIHQQSSASAVWTINHNLHKYPSVTVVDSGGSVVVGDVQYLSVDILTITFCGAFSGAAYLN